MAIHAYLTGEQHLVARYDFVGRWTWEEFREVSRRFKRCLMSNPEPTTVILDLSQSAPIPQGGIPHLARLLKRRPAHIRRIVLITNDHYLRFIIKSYVARHLPHDVCLYILDSCQALDNLLRAAPSAV